MVATFLQVLRLVVPVLVILLAAGALAALVNRLLGRRAGVSGYHAFLRGGLILLIVAGGVVGAVLVLPINEAVRSDLVTLLGVVISAAVALSSTTFLGNALAGILLRLTTKFGAGDFIRVGEHFGRVTEQGLLHTEIQIETSDLTTLPNLFVISQPVTVLREAGTVVSATVSLGYDVPREAVAAALTEAAATAGLEEPFVHILELQDFSVLYRCAGVLTEPRHYIGRQSALRGAMLDTLHAAGIEIVSPTFMNQRALQPEERFVPRRRRRAAAPEGDEDKLTEIVFEKAEQAATVGQWQERLTELLERQKALEEALAAEKDPAAQERHKAELARQRVIQELIEEKIHALSE